MKYREQKLQYQGLAKKAKFQGMTVIPAAVRTRVEVLGVLKIWYWFSGRLISGRIVMAEVVLQGREWTTESVVFVKSC